MHIEKNIPIPARNGQMGYAEILAQLEVGDSVLFPTSYHNLRTLIQKLAKRKRKPPCTHRFVVRTVEGGVLVWRVKEKDIPQQGQSTEGLWERTHRVVCLREGAPRSREFLREVAAQSHSAAKRLALLWVDNLPSVEGEGK